MEFSHIAASFQMHEWYQPQFTRYCGETGTRSRLDRMYCNQHLSFQLDRYCACTMLDCVLAVSHHRPISFARRTPRPKQGDDKPIPASVIKKAGWADAVKSAFQRVCKKDRELVNPIRRLVLLKDAIKEVSRFFYNLEEFDRSEALGPDDAQGYSMACLRALEKRDLSL